MSNPSLNYSIVDAFTTTAFKGNPAAVIVLDAASPPPSESILQNIAAEFNLSETAYVTPLNLTEGRFGLRWFTPKVEVALCGHATLASASVLFFGSDSTLPKNVKLIKFETVHSGVLTAKALPDSRVELEFPAGETTAVTDARGTKVREVIHRAFQDNTQPSINFIGSGDGASFGDFLLIEVGDKFDLENATVNPDPFRDLAPQHKIIMITQRGRGNETFRSRVFCPACGIPEDPVTGSAHCMLGPYWAKKLQFRGSVSEMVARQVSARSGDLDVSLDIEERRCKLRGHVALVAKGVFYLPN